MKKLVGSKIGLNVDKSKASQRYENRDYVFQRNSRLNTHFPAAAKKEN